MSIVMNFEAMFGSESELITDKLIPDILPVTIKESVIRNAAEKAKKEHKWLLLFIVGTKPCFYKFWGSIIAAEKQGIPYFIVNAGQHYDSILTYGIKEFNYEDKIAANLSIRGDLAQKAAEILLKMSWLAKYMKKRWPEVAAVPVVLGDTILTTTVPQAWMFSRFEKSIHLEAGLRTMYPEILHKMKNITLEKYFQSQRDGGWRLLNNEPFPEQYDTYTASAGCEYLFPPLDINARHLIREGYPPENIFTVGGVVVDALELKMKEKPKKSIFERFPKLSRGKWIRIDVHRKENLTKQRLSNIIFAVRDMVKKKKYNVNFIEMNATRIAMKEHGLDRELLYLSKYKNFLYTPIWENMRR